MALLENVEESLRLHFDQRSDVIKVHIEQSSCSLSPNMTVTIVSNAFVCIPKVQRHRLIYTLLGKLSSQFHSVSIHANEP